MIAKLCDSAGLAGKHSNHSLHATSATRLFENDVSKHQISSLTSHWSVAVRNYQCISSDKKMEQSNVLYGKKHKIAPTSTVISPPVVTFEIGGQSQLSQVDYVKVETNVNSNGKDVVKPNVNFQSAPVNILQPVIHIQQGLITVEPVINLCASELVKNKDGKFILPPINVPLTININ